jgi:uncharacterized membrane protein
VASNPQKSVVDAPVGSASVLVRRTAADVFAFVTTPENDPLWVRVCAAIRRLDDAPMRVGSRLTERVRFFGVVVRYEWEVTRLIPGRTITYSSRKGTVPMVISITVVPAGDDTTVTQEIEMRIPRCVPFNTRLARVVATREAERNVALLKRVLESPAPIAAAPRGARGVVRDA